MSNWMELSVKVNPDSRVSVKRAAEEVFGCDVQVSYSHEFGVHYISLPDCGLGLLRRVEDLLKNMKDFDNKSNPQVTIDRLIIY
ncbi:hypothetical protein NVP1170O_093 [Vibrio phage 1.170.O._10N.261.52.C3]|nr:hypothetical protein NVP1170O_093 [Vibrio phage 1.170.O._10N.261.52.C3]